MVFLCVTRTGFVGQIMVGSVFVEQKNHFVNRLFVVLVTLSVMDMQVEPVTMTELSVIQLLDWP